MTYQTPAEKERRMWAEAVERYRGVTFPDLPAGSAADYIETARTTEQRGLRHNANSLADWLQKRRDRTGCTPEIDLDALRNRL